MVTSLFVLLVLSGLAMAGLVVSVARQNETSSVTRQSKAFYMAEAGLNESLNQINTNEKKNKPKPKNIGTKAQPVKKTKGSYWSDIVANPDATFTVTSTGVANFKSSTIQAVISPLAGSVWDSAIFAGNSSGDPNYTLELGGVGVQADDIDGNIYSGGDVDITGNATVNGQIDAIGTITGLPGNEGKAHKLPNIAGMDYANNNDFDVAAMFATDATQQLNALGGIAWEMPEASPAHIFRKDPDDRLDEINGTAKADYFLEDPYMPVKNFTIAATGKEGHTITLAGDPGSPAGPDGSDKVYYIDGNLWVHNKPFGRLRLQHNGPDGMLVTFVVKGNIYFSDDVYTINKNNDAIAFVAIKDPLEADSGNIYLGDPRYGTLDTMDAFMFAENDFQDNNLDETGSATVTINGNMTAGNHVSIDRDYVEPDGTIQHSKLTVTFDDRLSTGAVALPGIPNAPTGSDGFEVVYWREIENQ